MRGSGRVGSRCRCRIGACRRNLESPARTVGRTSGRNRHDRTVRPEVKPGNREEFLKYFTGFCTGVVEPNEPRLHSFFGYTAPDSDLVTVLQIHPDADSMATHMKLIMQHISEAYADYLEPESAIQIYGTLSDELAQTIAGASQGRTDAVSSVSRSPASAACPQRDRATGLPWKP